MGCVPQLCADSKQKRCVVKNPDWSATLPPPPPPPAPPKPPTLSSFSGLHSVAPKVTHLHVCLCLFACFSLCGSSAVSVRPVRQLRQMWLARPLPFLFFLGRKKKEGGGVVGEERDAVESLPPLPPSTRRFLLPVTWPSLPGNSVVCGLWTRPVKRGQSQRWCW